MLFPVRIRVDTQIGDIQIALPFQATVAGPNVVCNIADNEGYDLLLKPLFCKSHAWKWSPAVVDHLLQVIKSALGMRDTD